MNFKSNMLKILVVFALILMIIPAIAAEDTAQDDEAAADSDDAVLTDSGADDSSETSTDTDNELEAEDAQDKWDEVIDSLIYYAPKRIVYISCNPITLFANLEKLSSHYTIKQIQPFDMFPQTHHIESVCLLELKK